MKRAVNAFGIFESSKSANGCQFLRSEIRTCRKHRDHLGRSRDGPEWGDISLFAKCAESD